MPLKKILIILLAVQALILAGCGPKASFDGYRQMMETYQGRHIDQLVAEWGPPSGHHVFADGRKLYTFNYMRREHIDPAFMPGVGVGFGRRHFYGSYHMGFGRTMVRESYCSTKVITDKKGIIREFSFQGNACRAFPSQGWPREDR